MGSCLGINEAIPTTVQLHKAGGQDRGFVPRARDEPEGEYLY